MVKRHSLISPDAWLLEVQNARGDKAHAALQKALDIYGAHHDLEQKKLWHKALGMAHILFELGLDTEGLVAAMIYPAVEARELHGDTVTDMFGESTAHLLRDVGHMGALGALQNLDKRPAHQLENLRKMLLAMVVDVRAVLIVLAERLWLLRHIKKSSHEEQEKVAQETMNVYAPLANRLGVGQLKWEMEDLCLRYLKPEEYQRIASWLSSRRTEREEYIGRVLALLKNMLKEAGIKDFEVTGRVKHIYSIYRKVQRKGGDLNEIYDISAVRIIVRDIADCYAALGVVHGAWVQIPKEFDDYITHPKPNGYKSIHTAIIGPEGNTVEVQIRTQQMHQESELGVAAHWRYKEGGAQKSSYEAKIAWLRQIMEWQREVAHGAAETEKQTQQPAQDLFADRVYVFTPTGDIVDLPEGATPLDFAYHVHSEVGHRCRGAKVNGNIVPLTYHLQMGERVEVLTAKQAAPSRDWLSPHLGYLKTSRARAKVQHWFKMQDYAQNITLGQELLNRELKRLEIIADYSLEAIAEKLKYKTEEDLLAALGAGDIRVAQIVHYLPESVFKVAAAESAPVVSPGKSKKTAGNIHILGVGNLLTQMANCCKPLPGEPIIGYITQGRGVSIHRKDCANILHVDEENQRRLITVEWGEKAQEIYAVDLYLEAYDRSGLLGDVTGIFSSEKINVTSIETHTDKYAHTAYMNMTIEISSLVQLERILDRLQQIPNVVTVRRQKR